MSKFVQESGLARDVEGYPIGSLPCLHKHYGVEGLGWGEDPYETIDKHEALKVAAERGGTAVVWFTTEPVALRD